MQAACRERFVPFFAANREILALFDKAGKPVSLREVFDDD